MISSIYHTLNEHCITLNLKRISHLHNYNFISSNKQRCVEICKTKYCLQFILVWTLLEKVFNKFIMIFMFNLKLLNFSFSTVTQQKTAVIVVSFLQTLNIPQKKMLKW